MNNTPNPNSMSPTTNTINNNNNNNSMNNSFSQRKNVKISKEIDLILCDFVERHPALWNPQDKNYHKSDKREELFEELSRSVKLPGSNLKERWGAIRHTFTKNVRKVEFSRQGPNADPYYKPSWPLFEKCLFLYEIVRRNLNKIKGNKIWFEANNSLQHNYMMDHSIKEDELNIKVEESEPCSSSLQLNTPEDSSSSYIPMTTVYDDDEEIEPPRKRRVREDSADNIQFLHPSDVISNMQMDVQDDCDTFGRLVVTKLKRMNENDAAEAQIEVLQVLKKYLVTNN